MRDLLREFDRGYSTGRATVVARELRFRLAEDRIRDLLMGESLYGDPALAIRELYQNALDACRLADARLECLRLDPPTGSSESPEIDIIQGVDQNGRAFIDCVDVGAGMSLDELSVAFCQAGVRSSDLPERRAEAERFARASPPVELWQNSRFGIGVLSYFMIADAMTVRTARLNPDGSVGSVLSAHIPGPGQTFDVLDLGASGTHGTRVRLWLRPDASVSAVSALRDLIISAPVHVRAVDQRGPEHRWVPGELNRASAYLELTDPRSVRAGSPGTLWWVADNEIGAVLADGIWAGVWLKGLIVNLRGPDSPVLTADRRKIVRLDWSLVEAIAEAAADSGVEHAWPIVGTTAWLSEATFRLPRLADAIVARASMIGACRLDVNGTHIDIAPTGYMPGDDARALGDDSYSVVGWRYSRLATAGLYPWRRELEGSHIVAARPSDSIMLGTVSRIYRFDREEELSHWFPSTSSIYEAERHLRYPLPDIVTRARTLGLPVRDGAEGLPDANDVVRTALSFGRRQRADGTFRAISAFEVLRTAWQVDLSVKEVVAELDSRFIEVDDVSVLGEVGPTSPLLIAASAEANGIAPWLGVSDEIGLDHVVRAARASSATCSSVVAILRSLGFADLPVLDLDGRNPTDRDVILLSYELDGDAPFLRADRSAHTSLLRRAAEFSGVAEDELRSHYREYGITFASNGIRHSQKLETKKRYFERLGLDAGKRKRVRHRHEVMMSRDGDGDAPWLDPSSPIPAWLVATLALRRGSLDAVIADYRWLGFDVDDPRTAPVTDRPGWREPHHRASLR